MQRDGLLATRLATTRAHYQIITLVLAGACAIATLEPFTSSAFLRPLSRSELPNFDKRTSGAHQLASELPAAVDKLRQSIPNMRVEFDARLATPKWIMVADGFLSGPTGQGGAISSITATNFGPTDPLRPTKAFLQEHAALFGFGPEVLDTAKVARDFVTPHNGMRTLVWQQQLDGIPVFEGLLISHTTRNAELVSLSSLFIPELTKAAERGTPNRAALLLSPAITPRQALVEAAATLKEELQPEEIAVADPPSTGPTQRHLLKTRLLAGVAQVQLVWLPVDIQQMRLCWEVLLTSRSRGEAFRVLVDAQSGGAWVRHCLTDYLTDASYRVYTSDSPSPYSPGCEVPCMTIPPTVPRTLVTLDALSTNASPLGWISDGANETRGNNVDAHTDRDANDEPDLPRPQGSPARVFDFPVDLTQSPLTYGNASVVQLFYLNNWIHDKLYELGFTEAAGNFQNNNFGRGGLGNDAVQADAQDGSGADNANFTTWPDGTPGRMQMYLFSGPNRDGDLDSEVVLHEYTHGLSNRRVGGGVGISTFQAAGLGEGWSDFYPLALLSEPSDDVNGTYPSGGYSSHLLGGSGFVQNYYFGIRRYPYSTSLEANPLTYKDIDPVRASAHTGVPRNPTVGIIIAPTADEVHNLGEVWCVTLWEARANLVLRYGFEVGNKLILQLVTDGMNLAPSNPTFLQARDAILLADRVLTGGANASELWRAFAKRGMGFSATGPRTMTSIGVHEAFDLPDDLRITPVAGLVSSGPAGGPFTKLSGTLSLQNLGTNPLPWRATLDASWLQVTSSADGRLDPAVSTNFSLSLTDAAESLPPGVHVANIRFLNEASGRSQIRHFTLRIAQPQVLFFSDSYTVSPYQVALQNRGYSYVRYTDQYLLADALDTADPDYNVAVVDATFDYTELGPVAAFVSSGGRALVQDWNLDTGSARFFGATISQLLTNPPPAILPSLYKWMESSCFEGVATPVALFNSSYYISGQRLQPLAEAQALGGFTSVSNASQAALVLGNNGRTLLQGFFMQNIVSLENAVMLAQNELDLLVPLPPTAPFITIQPESSTAIPGTSAALQAGVGGSLPMRYQWFKEGVIVEGATNVTFSLGSAQPADSGRYALRAENDYGSVFSAEAALVITNLNAVSTVLVFAPYSQQPYETALKNLGLSYLVNSDSLFFTNALAHANVADALVIVDAVYENLDTTFLERFVKAGGRCILQYGALGAGTKLASAFNVAVVATNYTRLSVYNWGGSTFFTGVRSPLSFLDYYSVYGQKLQPLSGARAVAGYTGSASSSQAAVVIGNSGRTILNGFVLDACSDPADAVRYAQNQIQYFMPQADSLAITPTAGATASGPVGGPFTTNSATFSLANTGTNSAPWKARVTVPYLELNAIEGTLEAGGMTNVLVSLTPAATSLAPGVYTGTIWFTNIASGVKQYRLFTVRVGQPVVLLMADTFGTSVYETALKYRGYSYQVFSSAPAFNGALALADPGYNLAIVHSTLNYGDYGALTNFVKAGGKVLLQDWSLQTGPIAAFFKVSVYNTLSSPNPVYNWGGSAVFNNIRSPLSMLSGPYTSHGQALQTLTGGQALAGYTSTLSGGQAALVLGNSGRTLVQGFFIDEVSSAEDAFQLAANELEVLFGSPPAAPTIVVQPASRHIPVGATAMLRVGASGSFPMSYQWRRDGSSVQGATRFSYSITNVQLSHSAAYDVVVTNMYGALTSSVAVLTVVTNLDPIGSILVLHEPFTGYPSPYTNALANLGLKFQTFNEDVAFDRAMEAAEPLSTLAIVDCFNNAHALSQMESFVAGGGRSILQYWNVGQGLARAFNATISSTDYSPSSVYNWGSTLFTSVASPISFYDNFNADGYRLQPAAGGQAAAGYTTSASPNQAALIVGNSGRTLWNGFTLEEAANYNQAVQLVRNELLSLLPPSITTQPADLSVEANFAAWFSVSASGRAPLSYQWYFNQTNLLANRTNAVLTWPTTLPEEAGQYSVVVANLNGAVTSRLARLTVITHPPQITQQPADVATGLGLGATFTVSASGTMPLFYQWRFNGDDLAQGTESALRIQDLESTKAGSYSVVVSNAYGTVISSNALLTILDPFITAQPQNQFAAIGSNATFTVAAVGSAPLAYQWFKNEAPLVDGTHIGGASTPVLTLSGLQASDAGPYAVRVGNNSGTITSVTATLTVLLPPTISLQPVTQKIAAAGICTLTAAATGSDPLTYRWQKDGTNLMEGGKFSGTASRTLTVSGVQGTEMGNYSLLVSNLYGFAASSNAALIVWPVVAWGNNAFGQSDVPASATNAVKVVAGLYHSLALKADGTVLGWGAGTTDAGPLPHFGQVMVPAVSNAVDIATGTYHSLAVCADGTVAAWGAGRTNSGTSPDFGQALVPAGLSKIVQVAAGQAHSLALKSDGTVIGWGAGNNYSFLPHFGQSRVPPGLSNVVAIAAGAYHSLALRQDGKVVAWGAGTNVATQPHFGQSIVPADLSNVVAIAAGVYHSVALKADGKVIVWGLNSAGQANVPAWLSGAVAIASGVNHVLAVRGDGTAVSWGNNVAGQTNVPALVSDVAGAAGGSQHTVLLQSDGRPFVTVQPWSLQIEPGASATFTVMASGRQPMAYQWKRNGLELAGATNPALELDAAQYADAGAYQVVITNALGSISSRDSTLLLTGGFGGTVAITISDGKATLTWTAVPGQAYQLQINDSLAADGWSDLPPVVTATTTTATATDNSALRSQRYYRIRLAP